MSDQPRQPRPVDQANQMDQRRGQKPATPCVPRWYQGLSFRLLALTALFVMVAEILIFAPSVGRFRLSYLEQRLADAHLALLAVEATPDGMVDMDLQAKLLTHAGAIAMTAWQPNRPALALKPMTIPTPNESFDLRERGFFGLIGDALRSLLCTKQRVIQVTGWSPADASVLVEAVVAEAPMITEMRSYGARIFALSALISLMTAALLYFSLLWLLVRPLRRMTVSMAAFRDAPQDLRRVIVPSQRSDEVGAAERNLCDMQHRLRDALHQQERLAAVGKGVSKITHDLKGVLTTALLESDRLEMSAADPEVRAVTQGIAGALERAVGFASSILRFASQGPVQPKMETVPMAEVIGQAVSDLEHLTTPAPQISLAVPPKLMVQTDREMLRRCLDNLLRNAIQASPAPCQVDITVSTGEAALGPTEAAAMVRVCVTDKGPGLPPKAVQNLFVPFSGSARPGGSGLGLPIAREMAETLGGSLDLTETGKGGTTFTLRLPR